MPGTGRPSRLALAAFLLLAAGCSSERRPPAASPTPAATRPAPAPAAKTTLRGLAQNAKAGAVVGTDAGPVYVVGLESWPDALAGRQVEVTGVVRQRKHIPDPVGSGGTVAQGAWGAQTVIEGATWKAAE